MKFARVLPLLIGIVVFVALIPLITASVNRYAETTTTAEPAPLSVYYVATTSHTAATGFNIPDFLDWLSYWENSFMVELMITDSGGEDAISLYSTEIRWYGDAAVVDIYSGEYILFEIIYSRAEETYSFQIDPDEHFDFDASSGTTFTALMIPH